VSLTGIAFILAFIAGIGFAIGRHPVYGLYTYVALFYLNPLSRWWGETLPDLRWSLLAGVITLLLTLRMPPVPGRPPWYKSAPARALIVFTAWVWLQNFWALDHDQHLDLSFLFTKYLILYYLIYRLVVTPEDITRFLLVHLAGCAYFGWLAFTADTGGRLEGVGGAGVNDANAFAMQMDTGVVVGAMIALIYPGARRWFAILSLPFILNGVVHSGSRGGILALLGGGLVLWSLKPKSTRKLFYGFAVLGLLLFGMLARDPLFWERMQSLQAVVTPDGEIDDSALSREVVVEAQLKMAESHPLGAGHRGTVVLSPQYVPDRFMTGPAENRRRASHNTFMSALVEHGIPGAILYFWLWGGTLVTVLKIKGPRRPEEDVVTRSLLATLAAGLIVVFIAGIFGDYIKTEVQIWFWALLGTLGAATAPEAFGARRAVAVGGTPARAPPKPHPLGSRRQRPARDPDATR